VLGPATPIARHGVSSFDDIALVPAGRGLVAVFSDATGTWLRPLPAQLAQADEAGERRLTERCEGGLSLLQGASLWLACSRPAHAGSDAAPDAGSAAPDAQAAPPADPAEPRGLWIYELDAALAVRSARCVGAVERDGRGVALAASGSHLFVAWADGARGAPAVQLATLPVRGWDAAQPERRTLSQPGRNGRQPALLFQGSHLYAVWSESQLAPGGETHAVLLARDGEPARLLRTVRLPDPAPRLAVDTGGLVLSFRDATAAGARPELFVARLSDALAFAHGPRRLGRANSEGAPVLALCGGTRAALAPLDHAGELYVAFHPLSPELRTSEANHQYYASGREFVLAAASCAQQGVRALLAERTQPARPGAELLSVEFHCSR
jgi:hypothetical protein